MENGVNGHGICEYRAADPPRMPDRAATCPRRVLGFLRPSIGATPYSSTFISADVPRKLEDEIQGVLAELAPLVTARIKEKRQTDFKSLLDVLLRGVKLRTLDIHRAQQQAKALEAVLENSEWLTAEEIGERGKFSPSNLAEVARPGDEYRELGYCDRVRLDRIHLQAAGACSCVPVQPALAPALRLS